MASLRPDKPSRWSNLGVRAASALVMGPAALAAIWLGGVWFLLLVSVGVALMAIEWALMSTPTASARLATVVTAGVLASIFLAYQQHLGFAWAAAAVGAAAAAAVARRASARPADAAFGVLYIGIPCLCLMWLRAMPEGLWWTLLLFAVAWAADIAAFLVGSLLKGPKLWPRFSPNKTWSGFVGGLASATAAGWALAAYTPVNLPAAAAAATGFLGGLATMGGDLLESMLKRRFGVKDSGHLIPGHGGLLDRVDGLMAASVAVAAVRLAAHLGGR